MLCIVMKCVRSRPRRTVVHCTINHRIRKCKSAQVISQGWLIPSSYVHIIWGKSNHQHNVCNSVYWTIWWTEVEQRCTYRICMAPAPSCNILAHFSIMYFTKRNISLVWTKCLLTCFSYLNTVVLAEHQSYSSNTFQYYV